ncbi:MAG: fructose-bisphosphatase class II, partial [Myxococcota bacterium]
RINPIAAGVSPARISSTKSSSRVVASVATGVVIGSEGAKDAAPMLGLGERVGNGAGPRVDVAVDPVDGTRAVAADQPGAVAALAAGERAAMAALAGIVYMKKLVVPAPAADALGDGSIVLDMPTAALLRRVAQALGREVSSLRVAILDRPRNHGYAEAVAECGAERVTLRYADLPAAVAVAMGATEIDMLLGIGGAPEAILAGAAVACLGGALLCRPWIRDDRERARICAAGSEPDAVYDSDSLVGAGAVAMAVSGVTDSVAVPGCSGTGEAASVHTIAMSRGADGARQRRLYSCSRPPLTA